MTTAAHVGRSPAGALEPHLGRKGLCPAPECRAARIPALALTVQQPHADAIVHGGKDRTWPIPPKHVGATVMIHAGKEQDLNADRLTVLSGVVHAPDLRGVVIGTVRLTGCHQAATIRGQLCCSPWGFPSPAGKTIWHWDLDDVQDLLMPIRARGLQKLWYPGQSLIEAVQAQMTGATK